MINKIIQFEDIRFCYGDVCAVHDVSFSVPKGQITALVGPNGGGKSTLIKLLAGFLKPDHGNITVLNNAAIGYVAQEFGFDTSFPITVNEAVLTGTLDDRIKPFKKYSAEQKKKALEAMDKAGLKNYGARGVNQLSGGQLRRVVVARALASDADILVLDEPDSNLDINATKELYKMLEGLKGSKTIIVASHHINYILDISQTAIYVNRTVKSYADPSELNKILSEGVVL